MVNLEVEKNPVLVFYRGNKKDEIEIPVGASSKATRYWFFGWKYRISINRYGGEIASLSSVDCYYFKGVI